MLPDPPFLIAFALASLAIMLTPGPDTLYVLTRSVGEGRLSGVVAVLGITAGLCLHVAAATFGLLKLFAHAPAAYEAVRWAGVAYLLYLAWQTFAGGGVPRPGTAARRKPLRRAFGEAALTNILNPKVILFFIAFFPQFTQPERGDVAVQVMALGALFMTANLLYLGGLALALGAMGEWLQRTTSFWRWQRWLMGTSLGAVAVWLALPAQR